MFLNIGLRASVVRVLAARLLLLQFKKIYSLVIPTAAASGAVLIAGILDIPVISTLVHQDIPVVPYQSHQYAITLVPSIGYIAYQRWWVSFWNVHFKGSIKRAERCPRWRWLLLCKVRITKDWVRKPGKASWKCRSRVIPEKDTAGWFPGGNAREANAIWVFSVSPVTTQRH